MPAYLRFTLAATGLLMLGGCVATPAQVKADRAPAASRYSDLVQSTSAATPQTADEQAQYHILVGEMAAGRQQPGVAAKEFLAALKFVDDEDLARRATGLALTAGDADDALAAARRWHELAPNEADPREVIASLSLKSGDLTETYRQCSELVQGAAGGPEQGFRHVAQILAQAEPDRADGALGVMQELAAKYPESAEAQHALGSLALHFGQLKLAQAAVERAMTLAPADDGPAMLQVAIWVRGNQIDKADQLIDRLAKSDKQPVELRLGYTKLLLEQNQRAAARQQLNRILTVDPHNADAGYALGLLAYNDGDLEGARKQFQRLLKGSRSQDAAMELGRIAESQQHYSQALKYYSLVTKGNAAIDAKLRQAYVLAHMGHLKEARTLMAALRDTFPQMETRFYLAEGELLVENGQNADALALYDSALDDAGDDPDLLYGRSLVYESLGKVDLAEKDLRQIIDRQPDDARALNALGYMLTVHSTRYDEAKSLIDHAMSLDPDDAAIIDSMGWLQFKLGHLNDALSLLRKAYAKFPDPEVAAHLGEVLWQSNDHEQALDVWNAALRRSPDNQSILEAMKRLHQ